MFYHCLTGTLTLFFMISMEMRLKASEESSDNTLGLESKIEQILEIHYLSTSFRSPFNKTSIQNGAAKIQIWRDLPPDPQSDSLECLGYQWLFTGRGFKMGEGAKKVFDTISSITSLELRLVDVSFETESIDKRGQLKKVPRIKPYLQMKVQRETAKKISIPNHELRKLLRENLEECLKWGRAHITEKEILL
jgi:hypothetical protein